MEDDKLCDRCKAINLEQLFNYSGPVTSKGKRIVSLGKSAPELKKSSCQLCRLFAAVRGGGGGEVDRRYHLRAFSSLTRHKQRITKARVSEKPFFFLAVTRSYLGQSQSDNSLQNAVILPQILVTANTSAPWSLLGHHVLLAYPTRLHPAQMLDRPLPKPSFKEL